MFVNRAEPPPAFAVRSERINGPSIYYVYILRHPDTMDPLYVGKGKRDRVYDHFNSKTKRTHLKNKLAKVERETTRPVMIEFFAVNVNEQLAFEVEQGLILQYGRRDIGTGTLYNQTDGGDGASGAIRSAETRARMAEAGRRMDPAKRVHVSAAFKHKSQEHLAKIGAARKGQSVPEEVRAKIRATSKATWERKRQNGA